MIYLAPSLYLEFSLNILKLNVKRAPDISFLFYLETLSFKLIKVKHLPPGVIERKIKPPWKSGKLRKSLIIGLLYIGRIRRKNDRAGYWN